MRRDTYSKLTYHIVFSTKTRLSLIEDTFRDNLYSYMGGVLRANGGTLLAVGGMPDHVHLLAGWGTSISVAKMLQLIKGGSSKWVSDRGIHEFGWQAGYGAFSVSASQLAGVRAYILNQEEHHRKRSFQDEFLELLRKHGVPYEPDED
jgi:putative transposase